MKNKNSKALNVLKANDLKLVEGLGYGYKEDYYGMRDCLVSDINKDDEIYYVVELEEEHE